MIISEKVLRIIGTTLRDRIRGRIRQNQVKPSSPKSGTTLMQSGRLMRSIQYRVDGNKVILGSNLKYARIHHEGGVITPKKAKFLAIPLQKIAKVRSPRDFENTFIRNGIIFQKQQDGKLLALYVLKKSVTIPARRYMYIDSSDETIVVKRITPLLNNQIQKELNK